MKLSDTDLIIQAQKGDQSAFEELVYRYDRNVLSVAMKYVNDEDDAINKMNSSVYGLQASVYTQNIEEAFRIADKLNVGTVQINAKPDRGLDNFPFGGVKDSGQMMQGITENMELMTRGKLTVINLHSFSKK